MSVTVTVLDRTSTRLRLLIDNSSLTHTITSVVRTDNNGTRTVRVPADLLPSDDPEIVVTDYEYSLDLGDTPVYTVYDDVGAARGSVTADPNTAAGLLHLTMPTRPAAGLVLNEGDDDAGTVLVGYDDRRVGRHTVHEVIDRADPVVVLHGGGLRGGTWTFSCPDRLTARTVQDTLASAAVLQLRQSDLPGVGGYIVATDVTTAPDPDSDRWTVTAQVTEVAWPAGPLVPITVWTYDDLAAAYGDYNAVAASFATYTDLTDRVTA